ncbi:hypothetical protein, partial [Microbacterium sp.]|uniref:hypothetical protein n=1 Tax=Microbacterium sp. TaxID=51671 RepID=UPI0025E2A824
SRRIGPDHGCRPRPRPRPRPRRAAAAALPLPLPLPLSAPPHCPAAAARPAAARLSTAAAHRVTAP